MRGRIGIWLGGFLRFGAPALPLFTGIYIAVMLVLPAAPPAVWLMLAAACTAWFIADRTRN